MSTSTSTSMKTATPTRRDEIAAELAAIAAEPVGGGAGATRRSAGENRVSRNARLIGEVAGRLSRLMDFGELEEQDLYTIGQLSDYLKVSLRTLRFYEQSGLLRPVREGTRRLYTRRDLDQLRVIVTLRDLEGSLGAIKALMTRMKDLDDSAAMMAAIEGLLGDIAATNRERIDELTRLDRRIETTLATLRRNG